MTTPSEPLAPCPFCGGAATLSAFQGDALDNPSAYVFCSDGCGVQTPSRIHRDASEAERLAREAWNRRPPPVKLPGAREVALAYLGPDDMPEVELLAARIQAAIETRNRAIQARIDEAVGHIREASCWACSCNQRWRGDGVHDEDCVKADLEGFLSQLTSGRGTRGEPTP